MNKRVFLAIPLTLMLAACGKSEAQQDYEACNEEFASGLECTEDEFRDFLVLKYEDEASIFGGSDEATKETENKVLDEIDAKINEIFE